MYAFPDFSPENQEVFILFSFW